MAKFLKSIIGGPELGQSALYAWTAGGWVPLEPKRAAASEWFLLVCWRPWPDTVRVVVLRAGVWMHYDAGGWLTSGGAEDPRLAAEQVCSAVRNPVGPAELCGLSASKIPWQTPFTYGEGGEIRLEPMAKEWLQREVQKREGLAEEMRAEAGESRFAVKQTLRGKWLLARGSELKKLASGGDVSFRCAPTDGLVEKRLVEKGTGVETWVPVVPEGHIGHLTWRRWVFLQVHVGIFGGHRLLPQTLRILFRVAWWPQAAKEIEEWIGRCATCIRFRRRPAKQDSVAVRPVDLECWQEIMIDFEGPSAPADRAGNRYVLTYVCCLLHAALFEPASALSASEVRRAFARCIFRSGTLPTIVRSDRGPEFKNALVKEFLALLGCRQAFGTAWRPMEQGIVERCHQELQKLLGLLVTDVVRSDPSEWTELLPVVEFMLTRHRGRTGSFPVMWTVGGLRPFHLRRSFSPSR